MNISFKGSKRGVQRGAYKKGAREKDRKRKRKDKATKISLVGGGRAENKGK